MGIIYVKVEQGQPKRPCSVRIGPDNRKQYCFGLNAWEPSPKKAWAAFQYASSVVQSAGEGQNQ